MRIQGVMAMVAVGNIEQATRFYRDVLGFTIQDEQEDWVIFEQGVGLHVSPEPTAEIDFRINAVMLTLFVDDVRATFHELTGKGVPFFLPPTTENGVTFATFRDTEGNLVQIMQQ
jgi:catechol 2,3-dioxygenase-like lactoylglutathione lyase family enzyme